MLKQFLVSFILAAVCWFNLAGTASAREIRIVGSSTIYPFASTVAEQFGATTAHATPIVETTGTGSGVKLFCGGVGRMYPDIASASRRMKMAEWDQCQINGVTDIAEIRIGHDGIVLANSKRAPKFDLTLSEIFLALAAEVPVNGRLVPNPNQRWSDVAAHLPDLPILVFGPPTSSGTRDAFVALVMEEGARGFPMLADMENEAPMLFRHLSHAIREDGKWINAGENDGAQVLNLMRNSMSVGVIGYSAISQNADRLQAAAINGVEPDYATIATSQYAISRSLYMYVKSAHAVLVDGLSDFLAELTDEGSWGDSGYLADKGLIPLLPEQRQMMQARAVAMTPMQAPVDQGS